VKIGVLHDKEHLCLSLGEYELVKLSNVQYPEEKTKREI